MSERQTELLERLLDDLSRPVARYNILDSYYAGEQPTAFLSPDSKRLLGNRFGRLVSNIPRLTVLSIAERLRIQGYAGVDIGAAWDANNMDAYASVLHREALLLGAAYALVWAAPDGSPRISVESAKQISVERDPQSRAVLAACKRWDTRTTTEAALFLPDRVVRYSADRVGATVDGFREVDELFNPLGVVPIVPFVNADRLLDTEGVSEIHDLIPLCDAANKLLVDLMTTSEAHGRPRRYATGLQLEERIKTDQDGNAVLDDDGFPIKEVVNPVSDYSASMAVAANPDTRFGQWASADMSGFESAMRVVMSHIGAVSSLPPAYLSVFDAQPTSAESIRAQESSLTARCEAKQAIFAPAWNAVAALTVAVRDGVDPATVTPRVRFGDPASRSIAAEADAAVKLFQSGLLSRAGTLRKLGFSDDEIAAERAAARAETLDGQGVNVAAGGADMAA